MRYTFPNKAARSALPDQARELTSSSDFSDLVSAFRSVCELLPDRQVFDLVLPWIHLRHHEASTKRSLRDQANDKTRATLLSAFTTGRAVNWDVALAASDPLLYVNTSLMLCETPLSVYGAISVASCVAEEVVRQDVPQASSY
jgi:hypothetical protein